jgi:hypothetical protein
MGIKIQMVEQNKVNKKNKSKNIKIKNENEK